MEEKRLGPGLQWVHASSFEDMLHLLYEGERLLQCNKISTTADLNILLDKIEGSNVLGLSIGFNRLGEAGATQLYRGLRNDRQLEGLFLMGFSLENKGAAIMGKLVKENESLKILSLRDNGITDARIFEDALPANNTLKRLFFSDNPLSTSAVISIAKGLKANCGLFELSLHDAGIDDRGAIHLAQALETNNHLVELYLYVNSISTPGGLALAESLVKNTRLRILNLRENRLTYQVAEAFAKVIGIGGNRTLLHLNLAFNDIRSRGVDALAKALETNHVIDRLDAERVIENSARSKITDVLYLRRADRLERRVTAFLTAQGGETTAPWKRSKLMVVGRGAAGKTSTIRSLLNKKFNPEWDSTIGVALSEIATTGKGSWEVAQRNYFSLEFSYRAAADAVRKSEEELQGKREKKKEPLSEPQKSNAVEEKANEKYDKSTIVIDEDVDSSNVVVTGKTTGKTFQYEEDMFVAQDEEDAIRMSVWDYGGQTVFYTLHHLFLTRYGVYLLVFNMVQLLESPEDSSEYLRFWLNSIKLHAPDAPVLLVGTCWDKLNKNTTLGVGKKSKASFKLGKVSQLMKEICVGFNQIQSSVDFDFYPLSNKDNIGVKELQKSINKITAESHFVQIAVSMTWMKALDFLSGDDAGPWVKMSTLKEKLKTIGINEDSEIDRMLRLFHELGVVLYFSASMRLKEIVICKLQWLLEKFALVIRDSNIHKYDEEKLHEIQLSDDLNSLLYLGIASRDLLEFLWDRTQVDYLLELMRHLLLLSDWKFGGKEELYLIPSMVAKSDPAITIEGLQFYLDFVFLPHGVFERVSCLCVDHSSSLAKTEVPELGKKICLVDLGDMGTLQIDSKTANRILVTLDNEDKAAQTLDFFLAIMRRIQNVFMHGGLQWTVHLSINNKFVNYETVKEKKLKPWVEDRRGDVSNFALEDFLGA